MTPATAPHSARKAPRTPESPGGYSLRPWASDAPYRPDAELDGAVPAQPCWWCRGRAFWQWRRRADQVFCVTCRPYARDWPDGRLVEAAGAHPCADHGEARAFGFLFRPPTAAEELKAKGLKFTKKKGSLLERPK